MKYLLITIAISLLTTIGAEAKEKMFAEASTIPNVTSVYISPAMLRLAGSSKVVIEQMGEMSSFTKDLNSVEILSSDDDLAVRQAVPVCRHIIEKNGLSELAVIKENGDDDYAEVISIYADKDVADTDGDTTVLNRVVILTSSADEFSLICLEGKLDLSAVVDAYNDGH